MRLFIASGIFHPESGGPATYLYRLLPELQARGHDVRVLTFGDDPAGGYPYAVQRIPRRDFFRRTAGYALASRAAIPWADLIYIHSAGLPLWPSARNKPRVLKIVGDLAWERAVRRGWIAPDEDIDRFQRARYDWRAEWFRRQRAREVRSMDRVIVPSQYLREMVIGWGVEPERVALIYNALDEDAPVSALPQAEARAALDLDAGPLLLTVARLTAWKGIDHLIRAIAQVPDVRLVVAGDGPDEARLSALADAAGVADRAIFLGRVPRDRLAIYFRAADYTVLYSGYEGLSHTLLESLRAGTPVIASDKGGNPEVVQHDQNGLLVPYVDVGALVDTIRAAFSGEVRARLAAGTAAGLERFRWATLVEQTERVLESVCTS